MTQQPYRVLARKYRPNNFDTLIGQDALVRTLTNAITHNRVAQAFMLTGVRGVGKTTTARIIAKALNCIGTDGKGDATPSPCGECSNCVAISEDRHVDVKEIDAASHNGVDQVREISENIHYRPSQARYSIIILDEVHMLTTQAFNAILKTLEEPPAHAKFIFATTEIRKVPVTVLSRCQRFDLRRVPLMQLKAHYEAIAASEQVEFDEEAISLIARAADGSVRDGLSLLDQAIALDGDKIALDQVRIMLGLADRAFIWEIYEAMLAGKVDLVLDKLQDLHHRGADPLVITHDMLDITHFLTRAKMSSKLLENPTVPELEKQHATQLMPKLSLAMLTQIWQMLLKGMEEIKQAPQPLQALEMLMLRLIHAADLPPLGGLMKKLHALADKGQMATHAAPSAHNAPSQNAPPHNTPNGAGGFNGNHKTNLAIANPQQADHAPAHQNLAESQQNPAALHDHYKQLAALLEENGEIALSNFLLTQIIPIAYNTGKLSFKPMLDPDPKTITRLVSKLRELTGKAWLVQMEREANQGLSIAETAMAQEKSELAEFEQLPMMQAIYDAIPGIKLIKVNRKSLPLTDFIDQEWVDPDDLEAED